MSPRVERTDTRLIYKGVHGPASVQVGLLKDVHAAIYRWQFSEFLCYS